MSSRSSLNGHLFRRYANLRLRSFRQKDEQLTPGEKETLTCPQCGAWLRPHVLWFDESYNDLYYHFAQSIEGAINADVLITVGTSGATNLPLQVGAIAAERGALLVDINPVSNPFSDLARKNNGVFLKGSAGEILPELHARIADHLM